MRVTLALGVAFAALAMTAYAQPNQTQIIVHHGGVGMNMDTDHDGWLTRAEASAAAERMFAELDSNHDDRLTRENHRGEDFDVRIKGPEGAPELEGDNCTTTVEPAGAGEGAERRVTVICRDERETSGGERHVERRVHVERSGDAVAPMPPHPPMFVMMFANADESDLNGDGAISRDEFSAQHLRFFDASDANNDGRVRFEGPTWDAPAPPEPPAPPAPPRRR